MSPSFFEENGLVGGSGGEDLFADFICGYDGNVGQYVEEHTKVEGDS